MEEKLVLLVILSLISWKRPDTTMADLIHIAIGVHFRISLPLLNQQTKSNPAKLIQAKMICVYLNDSFQDNDKQTQKLLFFFVFFFKSGPS